MSFMHLRRSENAMFNTLPCTGRVVFSVPYKEAIAGQQLHYNSIPLVNPHLSPSDQLFIKRPG